MISPSPEFSGVEFFVCTPRWAEPVVTSLVRQCNLPSDLTIDIVGFLRERLARCQHCNHLCNEEELGAWEVDSIQHEDGYYVLWVCGRCVTCDGISHP